MPRFNGQNKKRVDARYFLHEQDQPRGQRLCRPNPERPARVPKARR